MEAAGIEPESDSPQLIEGEAVRNSKAPRAANALHDTGTDWLDLSRVDSELRVLIEAWPLLPEQIKVALSTLESGVRSIEEAEA